MFSSAFIPYHPFQPSHNQTLISIHLTTTRIQNETKLTGSNVYPNHSFTNLLANSNPITLCPKHSTCASLLKTALSTEKESCAVTARIPVTLFAEIATPSPVPHIRRARSAFPSFMSLAASTAKWGYAVLSSACRGPTSWTEATRGSDFRSEVRAAL